MQEPVAGPNVVRRQLARYLRKLREGTQATVDEVVANRHLGISRTKLFRLESGKHSIKPQDVKVLCDHYGAPAEQTQAMIGLALATHGDSWWHAYGDDTVPRWFSLYADVEPAAATIRTYEAELVPGLLQTSDYARAVFRAYDPDLSDDELDRRVTVRTQRQAILDRANPPELHVVLSQAVLHRQVGGPGAMAAQVDKLLQLAARPNVTIDVLPFTLGAHAAMEATFAILDFPEPDEDPPVVYIEIPSAALYLKPDEYERYDQIFERIRNAATPIQELGAP